jgi:hypothetical protein
MIIIIIKYLYLNKTLFFKIIFNYKLKINKLNNNLKNNSTYLIYKYNRNYNSEKKSDNLNKLVDLNNIVYAKKNNNNLNNDNSNNYINSNLNNVNNNINIDCNNKNKNKIDNL